MWKERLRVQAEQTCHPACSMIISLHQAADMKTDEEHLVDCRLNKHRPYRLEKNMILRST